MKKRFKNIFKIGYAKWWDPYYQGFAAQMAFFYILSIVPLIGVLSQVLGLFDISVDYLREFISQYVKFEVAEILTEYLQSSNNGFTGVVMALIAIWAASRGQFAFGRIANYTMTGGKTTGGYFKERFRGVLNLVIMLVTIVFSLVVLVYGEIILKTLFGDFVGDNFYLGLRWLVAIALYFLMIACNYYMLPSERVPFKNVVPGAIFASIGLLAITWIYSKYMVLVASYNILYGSFATIVALLFWFYFLAWVMWLGLLFNKCWIDAKKVEELETLFEESEEEK
ncbi:MAG: YihY/virulence factor BrkB family protein [Clostridia bacterium]|nr:YihY/virulence factor BrkB family protein [Clostridia bacterium]